MIINHSGTIDYTVKNGGTTLLITIKMTPFEALYGYPPPLVKEYVVTKFKAPTVKNYLSTFDEILCILKSHIEQARSQIKQQVNLKRSDHEFEEN
jgi:hypothetical protein